jgi:hypothetical protein
MFSSEQLVLVSWFVRDDVVKALGCQFLDVLIVVPQSTTVFVLQP